MCVFHREIEHFRVISKVNLSSPYLWACFHILIPSFSGIGKGKKFDLMHKRLIIVVLQEGALKIFVTSSGGVQKEGKTG
jgi:hypothetical protein